MGGIIACCACQAACCCVGQTLSCFGRSLTVQKSQVTRVLYVALFLLSAILSFVCQNWAYNFLYWIPELKKCNDNDVTCYGILATDRMTFALFMFHFVFSLGMIGVKSSKDPRASLQDGWWPVKLLIWIGLVCLGFVIPNVFFQYFGYISMGGASLFILIQLVLLIDFAYSWCASWVRNWEEDDGRPHWFVALLICSIFLFVASATATILYYVYFCDSGDCYYNIIFVSVNLVLCPIFTIVSISAKVQEHNPRTGLLQSGVVTLYSTYLIGSALLSEPSTCNPYNNTMTNSVAQYFSLIFGAGLTIVAVCYSTIRVATSSDQMAIGSDAQALIGKGEEEEGSKTISSGDEEDKDDEAQGTSYSYAFFHLTFALGAMYMGCLITNWVIMKSSTSEIATEEAGKMMVDFGWGSVWVKMVSSWLTIALYSWTIIAPIVLPDREWN